MRNSLLLGVVAALLSVSFVFAQKGKPMGMMDGPMGDPLGGPIGMKCLAEPYLEEIGVSADNRAKIRESFFKMKKEMLEKHFQIQEKRIAQREEYKKEKLDEAKIKKIGEEIADLRKQMQLVIENQKLEVAKLLTAEQRMKVQQCIADRVKDWKEKNYGIKQGKQGKQKN